MNENIKMISKLCIVFIFLIATFFLLMILAYLLPEDKIKENAYFAISDFRKEGIWYTPVLGTNNDLSAAMKLDNYTDTLIMDIAVVDVNSDETNILKKAVLNQKYREGEDKVKNYEEIFTESKKPNGSYARYWFGTLPILKLLLIFITYSSIRYINMIFMLLLLLMTVLLIEKKIGLRYAISYGISFILCGFIIIPMSLQFSPVFIITLLSSIAILLLSTNEKFEKMLPYIFLVIGCLTAFFDLLTAPLLTFGIPIILLMLLRNKSSQYTFKENLFLYGKLAIIWLVAYALTYLSKWIIASIVLQKDVVTEAWQQFKFRSDSENKYNKLDTIYKNYKLYFNKIVSIFMVLFIVTNFIIIIKKKYYKTANYKNMVFLIIAALVPYLWYIVLSNHSTIHSWMTYRIQAITMMALLSDIFSFYDEKSKVITQEQQLK